MIGGRLIPLAFLGGLAVHGKQSLEEQADRLLNMKDRTITQQRMLTILEVAKLQTISGSLPQIPDNPSLLSYIQRNVRLRAGGDASVDAWNTPFRHQWRGPRLTLLSAGPDLQFGTTDDVQSTSNLGDY